MLKIGQNWGKIANHPPNAQQRSAPLILADPNRIQILKFKRWRIWISSFWIRIGSESLNLWIQPPFNLLFMNN